MRTALKMVSLSLLLFASCEKSSDLDYILKFYGDAYEDIGYSVSIAGDGYIIAGQLEDIKRDGNIISSRNKNMGVIKTGWDGNVIWKVSLGGKFDDMGSAIYQLEDGSLVCAGTFTDTTTALPVQTDMFVARISPEGVVVWQKHYGGAGNQTGKDIVKTPGGFMVLGTTDVERQPATDSSGNYAGKKDILLLNIKENGDSTNVIPHGFGGNDEGVAIKPDAGGNYVVFGTTERSLSGKNQNRHNLILIKVNSLGDAIEQNILGGPEDEYAGDMEVLSDGYLLAGTIIKPGDNREIFVSRLNQNIFSPPQFTEAVQIRNSSGEVISASVNAVSKYKSDSFVLGGYSGTGSVTKMIVFEIDQAGKKVPGHEISKGSTGSQVAYDVVSGDDEYIIAVGKNSNDVNSMITLLKFRF